MENYSTLIKHRLLYQTFPHKRGIRNGPKALKPVRFIIRCKLLLLKVIILTLLFLNLWLLGRQHVPQSMVPIGLVQILFLTLSSLSVPVQIELQRSIGQGKNKNHCQVMPERRLLHGTVKN